MALSILNHGFAARLLAGVGGVVRDQGTASAWAIIELMEGCGQGQLSQLGCGDWGRHGPGLGGF
jgi:hypothetical protein